MFKTLFAAEKALAQRLVEHIAKALPVKLMDFKQKSALSGNRITRALEQGFGMAREAHGQRRIGYLGRVVLASRVRWGLHDAGYPPEFVQLVVEGLIVNLSKKPA